MDPGRAASFVLTRRTFLKVAAAVGGAAALPLTGAGRLLLAEAGLASNSVTGPVPLDNGSPFFLSFAYTDPSTGNIHDLYHVAAALCDRIIPTSTDPLTGAVVSPGAAVASAVNYIDLFMAAFQQLPEPSPVASGLASTNPIWLRGRFSGRFPYGDSSAGSNPESGSPSGDDFETPVSGGSAGSSQQFQFLDLTDAQALSWYLRIYGPPSASTGSAPPPPPGWSSSAWLSAVTSGLIPGAQPLRQMYLDGLSAFDDWSQQNFHTGFASASQPEQDALVALASNPVLGAASSGGLPGVPAPLPNPVPPPAAAALWGVIVLHTIQGTYGLPEYRGQSDLSVDGGLATTNGLEPKAGTVWADIGWDGDTQPLGSSVYQYGALDPGYSTKDGTTYRDVTGAIQPQGGYVEVRPVSTPDETDTSLCTSQQVADWFDQMVQAGVVKITVGGAL